MNPVYMKIWRKENDLVFGMMDERERHSLCYQSLYLASRYETTSAQEVLKKITDNTQNHLCAIVLEATALVCFSLREFTASREFAEKSLSENPQSLFALQILARLSIYENKYSEAIQYYREILTYDSDSAKTLLNMAEAHFLNREFDVAIKFANKAESSTRKRLYLLFLSFSFWRTRLLWMLLLLASILNLYLFFSLFVLSTILLFYVAFQYGYKSGDLLIFRRSIYVQAVHSVMFLIVLCPTMAYLWKT